MKAEPQVAIIDIDNVLADDHWRHKLIDFDKSDLDARYEAYHAASVADLAGMSRGTFRFLVDGVDSILLVTARPEKFREITYDWVCSNFSWDADKTLELLMRPDGDHSHSEDLKPELVEDWFANFQHQHEAIADHVKIAVDDLPRVLNAYVARLGLRHEQTLLYQVHPHCAYTPQQPQQPQPPEEKALSPIADRVIARLHAAADTIRERNATYKDSFASHAHVMAALFPDGITLRTPSDHQRFALLSNMIAKAARFSNSGMEHEDSAHDAINYAAFLALSVLGELGVER